jgi:hypothetical protein
VWSGAFLTRARVLQVAVAVAGSLAGSACQDRSKQPIAPSFLAASSSLPRIAIGDIPLAISVNATLTAEGCSNNPGPFITFQGVVTPGGSGVRGGFGVAMTFTSDTTGTHDYTADHVVDAWLQGASDAVIIPKQPVLGGTGGNPFLWAQFVDATGTPVSEEIFLGRCVQGSRFELSRAQAASGSAFADVEVQSCGSSPGPSISITGAVEFAGLSVRIIFRNNDNPVGGPHEAIASLPMTVIPAGYSVTLPRQSVLGGVGGNPWILAGFLDGAGAAVGEVTLLGRCVQLSQT